MLFAGTASGTIAYSYGRRALEVVREVPAGNRSFRARRAPQPNPATAPPVNPSPAGESGNGASNPEASPATN